MSDEPEHDGLRKLQRCCLNDPEWASGRDICTDAELKAMWDDITGFVTDQCRGRFTQELLNPAKMHEWTQPAVEMMNSPKIIVNHLS